ncbi:MAG: DNA-directed polymerase subunit beta [Jatrophihabitantaceae bacterium]|nr:DNA-directed polymerase subunit beta [Jatrophihabitantaceae bacterium]
MRTLTVSVGQTVSPGQLIAYVGSEGQSTGAHLHLSIRLGGISGTAVDPQVWLAQRGVYLADCRVQPHQKAAARSEYNATRTTPSYQVDSPS